MKISNNIIYVTYDDLINSQLSHWLAHKHRGRYDRLPASYQSLVRKHLCDGIEPLEYLNNQSARRREQEMNALFATLADRVEIRQEDVAYFTENGYQQADANKAARAAGWLRLYRQAAPSGWNGTREDWKKEVFKQCLNEINKGWLTFGHKALKSEKALGKKAWLYEKQGCVALLNKLHGNGNASIENKAVF